LKQVADTADEDMEDQLTYLFRMAELSLEACEEGYGDDEEMQEKCEKKETRKMCYMYESMSQLCDYTLEQVMLWLCCVVLARVSDVATRMQKIISRACSRA
jgi:hypothetical protein